MTLAVGARLGPYDIVGPIGAGGMGEVYRARDTKLNRDVAIKVLPDLFANDPERLARFQREAQTLAALNHPNIAHIYGLEEAPSSGPAEAGHYRQHALVMELVEGEDLAQRIARGRIPLDEVLPIARQIAEALEAAHEQGIIHRDLKPANIKVRDDGTVKVLDFGLAKLAQASDSGLQASGDLTHSPTITSPAMMTGAGMILGTAAYMAPEQARGKVVDKRADIWAFGCVLYEMLTGRRPFEGETVSDILASVLAREPDFGLLPANLHPRIRELVRRSLEKNPKRRWQAAGDLRVEIETILEDPKGLAVETVHGSAPKPLWKRAASVTTAAIVGGIAVAIVMFVYVEPRSTDTASVQFTVQPKLVFSDRGASEIALSPDGRYLAFVDDGGGGQRALWLRQLGAPEPRLLSETENAIFPFWSPDSKFIGFSADGKLKKVSVDGGVLETLCEISNTNTRGTWASTGLIVYGGATTGLFQVPASGGVPQPLTSLDRTLGETAHQFPQFLPDERHFLYFIASSQVERRGIYVRSLESPDAKRVLAADHNGIYSPAGYLLVVRGERLLAYSFDPDRLEVTGEPIAIADGVGTNSIGTFASAAVSNNDILAFGGNGAAAGVQLAWYNRSGTRTGSLGSPNRFLNVRLSPDERRAALSRTVENQGGTSDIWLVELSTGVFSKFTLDPASAGSPVWSPDSRYVAFWSNRKGNEGIYQKEVGGSEELLLVESPANKSIDDWTKDGASILFRLTGSLTTGVFELPLAGDRKPVQLLPAMPYQMDELNISPDGNWIAYNSNESGRFEVWVASFPAFTSRRQVSNSGGAIPRWRQDSRELFYLALDGKLMAADVKIGPGIETGAPRLLFQTRTNPSGYSDQYAATGDGQRFLLLDPPESETVPPITVITNWTAGLKK